MEHYRNEYKELMKQIRKLNDDTNQAFPTDLYEQFIEQATVYKYGKVVYQLSLGLEWSTDEKYEEYKQQVSMERKAQRHAERKEK